MIFRQPVPEPGVPVALAMTEPSSSSTSRLAETSWMSASSACTQTLMACIVSSVVGAHQYCESNDSAPAPVATRCAAIAPAYSGAVPSTVTVAPVANGDHP